MIEKLIKQQERIAEESGDVFDLAHIRIAALEKLLRGDRMTDRDKFEVAEVLFNHRKALEKDIQDAEDHIDLFMQYAQKAQEQLEQVDKLLNENKSKLFDC